MVAAIKAASRLELRPQPGPQTEFLKSRADVVFFGGAAGGGKTYGLTLELARHVQKPGFRAIIFRRTGPELIAAGGLWQTAKKLFIGRAHFREAPRLEITFASDAVLKYSHLEHESDADTHQGAQYNLVCFDEVTHFTRYQFLFLLGRLRDGMDARVRPYLRATCNPDPDSWVYEDFIRWYIGEDGFPIPERCGVVRYFTNEDNNIIWGATIDEVVQQSPAVQAVVEAGGDPRDLVMSFTFIPSKLSDNKLLMARDPGYLGKLLALSPVDRARMMDGNWHARDKGGTVFRSEWFEIVDACAPSHCRRVRYWDLAGSKKRRSDCTAGVKVADDNGITYVEDVVNEKMMPAETERLIYETAVLDGPAVEIWIEEEKGAAGQILIDLLARTTLKGFTVIASPVGNEDKLVRAKPVSAAAAPPQGGQYGRIRIVRAPWNKPLLTQLQAVPDGSKNDMADGLVGGWHALAQGEFSWASAQR